MLDFKKIAETPIVDVAKMLSLSLTDKGEQWVGTCPISKVNNATAFKITPSKNRFICFCSACKKLDKQGGDCIEMVRRVMNLPSTKDAAQHIVTTLGAPEKTEAKTGFDPLSYLESLDTASDQLTHLGISPETLRAFKAGYCGRGVNRGKLAVGICDMEGNPKAFVGVPLFETNELLYPKDYRVSYYLGVQLVEEGELHLFDTIKDALHAYENGLRSILILLQPITSDTLTSLQSLMKDRKCTTLEICY